jgi:hypothetical protein
MDNSLWIVIGTVFVLTLAVYLMDQSENFVCFSEPSPFGQGYYFGAREPGPAWAYSPRDRGWDDYQ